MEALGVVQKPFWKGRKVLVTGHTGFKGAWLSLWLQELGAAVFGMSLAPAGSPNLFEGAGLEEWLSGKIEDIRSAEAVRESFSRFQPEIVLHLAAQAIVRRSYREPLLTFDSNVMGTVNVLDAARHTSSVRCIVVVTSDKCYENLEWDFAYRENDRLGGKDPYSASKACAELVVSSYRRSFFDDGAGRVGLASARAGNVIGGGDWAEDRLIPDCIRAFRRGEAVTVRNPRSLRPWQHVLDALHGYLLLAQALFAAPTNYSEGWNFSPPAAEAFPVAQVVEGVCRVWGEGAQWHNAEATGASAPHEAACLRLDSSLAQSRLKWRPLLSFDDALKWTISWYRRTTDGANPYAECVRQIDDFMRLAGGVHGA